MTAASDRLLRRLEWQVLRRLDGRVQGAHRTLWRGVGIDVADLREYTPEDDVRHIDWNVTARLDEPYVRRYTEDRELTAWLVLDRSASMRVGAAEHGKDTVLRDLAVCLARLFTGQGNPVGAVLFDNASQRVIPPRTGRTQALRVAHELDRAAPPTGATTDLAAMLRLAATTARRRSLVLVLSDFIGDPGWDRALALLAHRHEVVAVRIVDPAELELPDLGLVLVEDAETGEQLLLDTGDPLLRQRFAEQAQAREAELDAALRRGAVTAHRVDTDEDLVTALIEMVWRSKRRRR
ncbi:DUF58 domain-containing protein [Catellatospora tritici]|uniref:DUF58 domain-containing protein n=1 Tax=Catellatospora tritici TaxID=2851566 RepID=UPI001C2DCE59|nr:DUF58 domain-containing protein [Catellatospora tritici]MBV1853876.1 DUF58 domain-containing protein [Catellatospora tritici]